MKNILIFGAGSIGNHMTYASIKLGHKVYITDKNFAALERMKKKIYPKRYGKWNKNINQINNSNLNKLNIFFDLIIIGTPPKTHIKLLNKCKKILKYDKILIEKPLSSYLENFNKLENEKNLFCGYNHSVSQSFQKFLHLIEKEKNQKKIFISIKWQESFKGILGAHFWLKDEYDTYLGDINKGGGAIHEHSHGLHLAIYILKKLKIKNYDFNSNIFFKDVKNKPTYDVASVLRFSNSKINLVLETDLLEDNPQKKIIFFNSKTKIIWHNSFTKNLDCIDYQNKKFKKKYNFKKNRSSEFEKEIYHIFNIKNQNQYNNSPLNIKYSIEVMKKISRTLKNAKRF